MMKCEFLELFVGLFVCVGIWHPIKLLTSRNPGTLVS